MNTLMARLPDPRRPPPPPAAPRRSAWVTALAPPPSHSWLHIPVGPRPRVSTSHRQHFYIHTPFHCKCAALDTRHPSGGGPLAPSSGETRGHTRPVRGARAIHNAHTLTPSTRLTPLLARCTHTQTHTPIIISVFFSFTSCATCAIVTRGWAYEWRLTAPHSPPFAAAFLSRSPTRLKCFTFFPVRRLPIIIIISSSSHPLCLSPLVP